MIQIYIFMLSHSYIPLYVHVRPSYREKTADLQGTLKPHVRFYNRISRSQTPRNKNWRAHYSLHADSVVTNTSMSQRIFTRDFGTCILLATVVGSPHLLALLSHTVSYTYVYRSCI